MVLLVVISMSSPLVVVQGVMSLALTSCLPDSIPGTYMYACMHRILDWEMRGAAAAGAWRGKRKVLPSATGRCCPLSPLSALCAQCSHWITPPAKCHHDAAQYEVSSSASLDQPYSVHVVDSLAQGTTKPNVAQNACPVPTFLLLADELGLST